MKISKVDHTRFGIGEKNRKCEGMLYYNPSKEKSAVLSDESLKGRVEELNRKAKNLYNVFNPINEEVLAKESGATKEEINAKLNQMNKMRNSFMTVCKKVVRTGERNKQIQIFRNLPKMKFMEKNGEIQGSALNVFEKVKEEKKQSSGGAFAAAFAKLEITFTPHNDAEDFVREFVNQCLRKAYCIIKKGAGKGGKDIVLKNTVVNLLLAVTDQGNFDTHIRNVTDDELELFLDILMKDYYKEKRIDDIVKSIKNKDTKVQVVLADDNVKKLAPSCYGNKKKGALFDFMIEYADADEVQREKLRRDKSEFVWKYLQSGDSDGIVFSEAIEKELCLAANISDKQERMDAKEKALVMVDWEIVKKYKDMREEISETDKQALYWLNFFSEETSKWVKKSIKDHNGLRSYVSDRRLLLSDIQNHLNKYFYSFLAMKYVDLGKAVYHFTDYQGANVGAISDEFANGITSFDYERISAEDNVKRDLATYVSFAVNNFASSVCDTATLASTDDALSYKAEIQNGAKRNILRYFGGIGEWDNLEQVDEKVFAKTFREHIAAIRNHIIHFDADFAEERSSNNRDLIKSVFDAEYSKLSLIYAKKYYSNNLPMFYAKEDLYNLVNNSLYRSQRVVAAGIPAFNRLVPRSKTDLFLTSWLGNQAINPIKSIDKEAYQKYQSAMFFVLKEIYYYGFLMDADMLRYMEKALENIGTEISDNAYFKKNNKEQKAFENYEKRFRTLINAHLSAGAICEQIMLDMTMQNHDVKEVKTKKNQKKLAEKEVYQHFRMILYKQLEKAFCLYLEENADKFGFLKKPRMTNAMESFTAEEFAAHVAIKVFEPVKQAVEDPKNPELLSWYATAHFMSKKQLNHLCGSIHTELRYLNDVDRRADSTGNRVGSDTANKMRYYEGLLRVFEFTMNFCDQCSNRITDYFEDEDDYATMLASFVNFDLEKKQKIADISASTVLKDFCAEAITSPVTDKIGLYYDVENPIANRNVVRACMYGSRVWLTKGMLAKIEREDIEKYYALLDKSRKIENGLDKRTKKEQELIRDFQNVKNRVELTDIVTYVDIVNDLYGQLLSWIYLRERDLIYMQLGFYYTKLMWGKSVEKSDTLRRISIEEGKDITDGAILYMIRAMYSHDMPMPKIEAKGRIGNFLKTYSVATYYAGTELFEHISTKEDSFHDEMIGLRNYIAHFKYFSKTDHSLEELFGDVFSEFFGYNDNLHKSISVVYKNLLAQHKVLADLEIAESESSSYFSQYNRTYKKVKWAIKADRENSKGKIVKGLDSDTLTFKVADSKKELNLPAHDDKFLCNVRAIVTYKKN